MFTCILVDQRVQFKTSALQCGKEKALKISDIQQVPPAQIEEMSMDIIKNEFFAQTGYKVE